MRNWRYLFFWTELGRRLTGGGGALPDHLPSSMMDILREAAPADVRGGLMTGLPLDPRASRFIYGHLWKELRELGFSRPLRLEPWPGVRLLVPFYRNRTGVVPQSFSGRIPHRERALALVGKAAAARISGYELLVVMASWNDEVRDIMERGGVSACSLDRLEEMLAAVDVPSRTGQP